MNDIVILLQEKNLLIMMAGRKNYIEVGDIERQLDWPIRIKPAGHFDGDDFYSSKLRQEIDE